MIDRSETSLSAAEYASIQTETGSMAATVTVKRYGPVWAAHPSTVGSDRSGSNFDAILIAEYLLRAYTGSVSEVSVEYMPSEVSGISDASWTGIDCTAVTDVDDDVPISLATLNTLGARIFYVNEADGNVHYSDCADITTSVFGDGSGNIAATVSTGTVQHVAAVSSTKVYFVVKDSDDNMRMYSAEYDESWSTTDYVLRWPCPIYGFDAVVGPDSKDVIAMSTELLPLIGTRVVGADVTTEVNRVQGVVVFRVENDRFSDWQPIDVIDRLTTDKVGETAHAAGTGQSRQNARITYHNNYLFVTYRRTGGVGENRYDKVAVSRSADGENWEFPEFVSSINSPFLVIPRSDYLYAVGVEVTLRSPECTWAGQSPTGYDATSYTTGLESSAADIRNTSLKLANPSADTNDAMYGDLSDELIASDDRLQVEYELGYYVDGTAAKTLVSTEDVTSRIGQREYVKLGMSIGSTDRLGRLNRTRSDFAAEWPSTQCGRDAYNDPTGTGYGGLRHTAPYDGSFKAENGVLSVLSNNKESLAISTFVSDTMCGSAEVGFTLSSAVNNEYAGIAFRVYDKHNLFYVVYHPDEDEFVLAKRVGSTATDGHTDTSLDTVDATSLAWEASETNYIKVHVDYNLVYLYTSSDGKTWATVTWDTSGDAYTPLPGLVVSASTATVWSGRFGVIGRGYSDDDTPPPWSGTWYPPSEPPTGDVPDVVILWCRQQVFRTINFSETTPDWTLEVTGLESTPGTNLVKDASRIRDLALTEDGWAYAATEDGCWKCDMTSSGNTWTQLFTIANFKSGIGFDTNPVMIGVVEDTRTGSIVVHEGHTTGTNSYSSAYASIDRNDNVTYARSEPYKDRITRVVTGGCNDGGSLYYWIIDQHADSLGTGEYARAVWEYFQANTGDRQRLLHFTEDLGVVCAGRVIDLDNGLGNNCSSAAVNYVCGSPLSLLGPLRIPSASCITDFGTKYPEHSTGCPGNSNNIVRSVDGDAPYEMLYIGSAMYPYGGGFNWRTDLVDSWVLNTGPNGYGGYAWCGALVDSVRYLVNPDGDTLFVPGDYYLSHTHMGYTEGNPNNGLHMLNIQNTECYKWRNLPYAMWSEDGGETWVEKTATIRLSTGLNMDWKGGTFHGAELYKYGKDGFS